MMAFVYPVSAVMKFWHWLLAGVFGMESSHSWVASVVLLVATIRALIAPLQWTSYKTSRILVLMRPRLAEIERTYGQDVSAEAVQKQQEATRELHREYRYNPFAGCLPALIQVPFFLGLYRLLLWMALPERADSGSLGVLSPQEVESFRASTLAGVPLPAYVSMRPEQFAHLGTSLDDVRSLAVPLLITAVFFTTFNMVLSQLRNRSTLDWSDTASKRVYRFMWFVIPIAAAALTTAGLTGLVPVALLLYWVSGNFWTLMQTIVLWVLTVRAFPLEELHRAHIAAARRDHVNATREVRKKKRSRRRRRVGSVVNPRSYATVRREIKAEKNAVKAAAAEAKREKKRIAAERRAAVREAAKRQRENAASDTAHTGAEDAADQME